MVELIFTVEQSGSTLCLSLLLFTKYSWLSAYIYIYPLNLHSRALTSQHVVCPLSSRGNRCHQIEMPQMSYDYAYNLHFIFICAIFLIISTYYWGSLTFRTGAFPSLLVIVSFRSTQSSDNTFNTFLLRPFTHANGSQRQALKSLHSSSPLQVAQL